MGESMILGVPADPKQARSKKTKEKIVQAAIRLFEERGYEKTTSNDIASEAGVSVGSFYVYFSDKRQLLFTIFDRLADELYKNIFDGLKPEHLFDSDLRRRIRHAVANTITDKQKHAGLHRVVSELLLKDADFAALHKVVMSRSMTKLHELISLARKAGLTYDIDVEAAAFMVQRVVFDISQDYVTRCCEFDQERAIDALADMIYRFVFKPNEAASPA